MSTIKKRLQASELLESVLFPITELARSRGLTLDIGVADNVPDCFYSDRAKLSQVLSTLTEQAIKRTCRGGVKVSVASDGDRITFCVQDSGRGVDPDAMMRILSLNAPMSDWPREDSNSDSALALRIASKLVGILGGSLQCECRDGGPTRFYFSIDCPQAEEEQAATAKDSPSDTQKTPTASASVASVTAGAHILVVDDVTENRILVDVLLKKLGLKTSKCANGQEAFDLCCKEQFDAVLMDIQMPVMNGLEAAKKIRSEGLNRNTTILAMTASNHKSDELAAIEAGCDGCLEKPIDRAKLERKMSRITARVSQVKTAEQGGDIVSFLEGDPDYHKAVESFIAGLPGKIEEMRQAFEKGDLKDLAFKVHALKGLGGFAGFPVFTEKAKVMEQNIHQQDLQALQSQLDEMVQLCLRTRLKTDA